MESSHYPTAGGALGARFKAGLQSALNGLVKVGTQSSDKLPKKTLQPEIYVTNGSLEASKDDAILGEPENDDDMAISDCDDALLGDGEPIEKSCSSLKNVTTDLNLDAGKSVDVNEKVSSGDKAQDIVATESDKNVDANNELAKSHYGNCNEKTDQITNGEVMKETSTNNTVLESNTMTTATSSNSILTKPKPNGNDHQTEKPKLVDKTEAKTNIEMKDEIEMLTLPDQTATSESPLTNSNSLLLSSKKSLDTPASAVKSDIKLAVSCNAAEVEAKPEIDKPIDDSMKPPKQIDDESKEAPQEMESTTNSSDLSMSIEENQDKSSNLHSKSLLLSPEEKRADTSDEILSSPSFITNNTECGASALSNSSNRKSTDSLAKQPDAKIGSNNLSNQTNIKQTSMDDDSTKKECDVRVERPARGKVSASIDSNSDDDVVCIPPKRAKLSTPPVEPEDRLNKLISHLSTAIDGPPPEIEIVESEDEDDGLRSIQLKKNGLASFYDAIIKTDVIKDAYHEELSQRHQELQIKNNMDAKKIQKILHEVKSVREKLKSMNIRPAQRSVSTQICSEKLQVPTDQQGNRIIKSRVLSKKAVADQRMGNEAMRQMSLATKANNEWQLKQQADFNAKKLAEQAAKQNVEHSAKVTAAVSSPAKEPDKAKSVSLLRPPSKPVAIAPKPSSQSNNEVIDLTAEDEPGKTPPAAAANTRHHLMPAPAKTPPMVGFATKPLHPAPLPPCPLTGQSGHLLKPNAPRLELSSKEDGIVLQWNMQVTKSHARVTTYQIFGYKERAGPLSGMEWKKVGDLKALPLPMACTLTQFQTGHTYHFAVRAVDELGRTGPFGVPRSTKLG